MPSLGVEIVGRDHLVRVLTTSFRTLASASCIVITIAVTGGLAGWWSPLLGLGDSSTVDWATTAALTALALSMVPSASNRLLVGSHRNDLAIAIQALAGFLTFLVVAFVALFGWSLSIAVSAWGIGAGLAGVLGLSLAQYRLRLPVGEALARTPHLQSRGARIRHMAGPMLIIGIAIPIAYQSDRMVLSWFSTLREVSVYSLAAPVFAATLTLVGAAGASLWPVFAERRGQTSILRTDFLRLQAMFLAAGVLLALLLLAFGPVITDFMSRGEITVSHEVMAGFGLLVRSLRQLVPTCDASHKPNRSAASSLAARRNGVCEHRNLNTSGRCPRGRGAATRVRGVHASDAHDPRLSIGESTAPDTRARVNPAATSQTFAPAENPIELEQFASLHVKQAGIDPHQVEAPTGHQVNKGSIVTRPFIQRDSRQLQLHTCQQIVSACRPLQDLTLISLRINL